MRCSSRGRAASAWSAWSSGWASGRSKGGRRGGEGRGEKGVPGGTRTLVHSPRWPLPVVPAPRGGRGADREEEFMLLWFLGNASGDAHHTLRAALAGLVAFAASLLLGPRVIAWLRAKKVGERVAKEDSKQLDQLMQGKSGTPTMGGVFVVAAILASLSLFGDFTNPVLGVLVFTLISLGALGAVDDYLKLSAKCKTG